MIVDADMLSRLRTRLTENGVAPDDSILIDCIESAKYAILSRRFPFGNYIGKSVEPKYKDLQYRIAVDIYNKLGAEGQLAHSENGISRTFEGAWVSPQLLCEVVPYAGVIADEDA